MNERKKGAILSYVQVILSVIVNIIYVPVLLHYLGRGEYGLYQIVGSCFSYVSVFESCMSTGVLRNYCNSLGKSDEKEAAITLSMARNIYRIMSILMILIGIIVLFVFRWFYKSSFSRMELNEGTYILILLFINMIFTLLGSIYLTILTAHEKFTFLKISNILIQILQPILVILCIRKFPYAISISTIIAILNLIMILFRYLYVDNVLDIKIADEQKNDFIIKEIIGLAGSILLGSIADQIFWKTDQVILGKMFSTSAVAVYSVGAQIYMIYMQFGTQVSSVFYPRLSMVYHEIEGDKKISELFIKIGRITLLIILLILSGFIIFGKEFLEIWVGDGYKEAYYVAIIIMCPFSIDLSQNIALSILQMKNQYSFRAKIYLLSAIINIILTIILSVLFGIIGAAISTAVSMFVTSGIIMNWYYAKKVNLDIKKFWLSSVKIIMVVVIMIFSTLLIKKYFWINSVSVIQFSVWVTIYILIYIFTMVLFVLNQDERKQIKSLFVYAKGK